MTLPAAASLETAAKDKLIGRLAMVVAAVMWSTSGLFAKMPLFDDWPVAYQGSMLAFWRSAFAALVLLPTVRRPRWNRYLVPLTACFTVMNVIYLTSMTRTTAANAIWLQSTAPWWVFLLGVFVLRDPIARRDLVPLGFAVLGVGTILAFEVRGQAQLGVACGVASGVAYACVVLLMRQVRGENPAWIVALNHAVASLMLLPWIVYLDRWPSPVQLAVLAVFGAFQMGIPYTLLLRALRSISSHEAVAIGLIEPVLVPFWAFLARGEQPAWWTMAGAVLILVGLLLRYVVWDLVAGRWNGGRP
ncbi:MAG: EamA family transporter [Pirellulales bacterium]|nr:EamA family transporter [Pirellulales bacterium]